MFDFSIFDGAPLSKDFKVFAEGKEIPVYTCRISAHPFNTWWPGHQRPLDQSETVSYVNLISDEKIDIEVEPLTKTAYERLMLKPYAKGVKAEVEDGKICFTLCENGGYVLELDDYHGLLYIFNNKPVSCDTPEEVTHYFGKGVHDAGKITLNSGDSVYVDKDALVYGCVFAEGAENIRIFGNGIFDDSREERLSERCYDKETNGNLKLYDCKSVRIEGVGFADSAIWCINIFHCLDVEIDGINVFGQWRYNTDGIDIVNSRRITVKNSFVHSFDDSITIKGIDKYSFESNSDILVENCVLWCDWGRTLEIGLETECREYKDIAFRNCHVLRGGCVACDIQNGDRAEVHHVTFENISVELESFYTPEKLQENDGSVYDRQNETALARVFNVSNKRFREAYSFLGLEDGEKSDNGKSFYASVHDITVKNVAVYSDEKILEKYGTKCVRIKVENIIPTTEYKNISVESVTLNGKPLNEKDMEISLVGDNIESILTE